MGFTLLKLTLQA